MSQAHAHRLPRTALTSLAALVIIAATAPPVAAAGTPTWGAAVVTTDGNGPSLAIEASGKRHIVAVTPTEGLLYFAWTGTGYSRTVFGQPGDMEPQLVLDGTGKAHVVFFRKLGAEPGVYYATNRSGSWRYQYLHELSTYTLDISPTIAVDPLGEAHVAFADAGHLWYGSNRRGYWVGRQFELYNDSQPSIAIDADRHVYIAHVREYDTPGIFLTSDATGHWVTTRITQNDDWEPSIAFAPSGALGVAFRRTSTSTVFATNASGSWVSTKVTGAGPWQPTLRFDSGGAAWVASNLAATVNVTVATNRSGSWVSERIGGLYQNAQWLGSLAIGPGRVPVVAWGSGPPNCEDCPASTILLSSRSGPSWVVSTLVPGTPMLPDLAFDTAGHRHFAWSLLSAEPGIRYRTDASGTWVTKRATTGQDRYPSLKIDAAGKAHIAFIRSAETWDLWYATNASGTWVATPVSVADHAYPVLNLDSTGKPVIAAIRGAGQFVRYVFDGSSWSSALTTGTSACVRMDAVLDSADHFHGVCLIPSTGALRYVTNATGSWVGKTMPNPGDPGQGMNTYPVGIALDGAAKVHVFWTEANLGVHWLRYSTNRTGAWVSTRLVLAEWAGDLAVTSGGVAHLVVPTGQDYTNAGGPWELRYTPLTGLESSWTSPHVTRIDPAGATHIVAETTVPSIVWARTSS